jgi:hypothetical protein
MTPFSPEVAPLLQSSQNIVSFFCDSFRSPLVAGAIKQAASLTPMQCCLVFFPSIFVTLSKAQRTNAAGYSSNCIAVSSGIVEPQLCFGGWKQSGTHSHDN